MKGATADDCAVFGEQLFFYLFSTRAMGVPSHMYLQVTPSILNDVRARR